MGKILYPDGTIAAAPKEHVFLAGMMKSGGIHISNSLGLILGWRRSTLCSWQQAGMVEHDINPYVAATVLPQGAFIFHMHTRAWATNTDMLKNWQVRPIVLIRNVADIIMAVRDGCLMDHQKDFDPKGLPGIYVPGTFNDWTREHQELFLAQNLGPWLLSFYVSWRKQQEVPVLWVTYEEHFRDQVTSFRRMLEWVGWGTEYPTNGIERVANMRPHNFNKGVSGRGKTLSTAARDCLEAQVDAWGPEWASEIREKLLSWTDDSGARQTFSRPRTDSPLLSYWRGKLRKVAGSI